MIRVRFPVQGPEELKLILLVSVIVYLAAVLCVIVRLRRSHQDVWREALGSLTFLNQTPENLRSLGRFLVSNAHQALRDPWLSTFVWVARIFFAFTATLIAFQLFFAFAA